MQPVVAELYRVLKPYRLGDDFAGCECCVPARNSKYLASVPLQELTVADLNRYAFKAMTTWGRERHFKHFLPRLLELALDAFLEFENPETLLGKLTYAKWQEWPRPEQDAIAGYLDAYWQQQLNYPVSFPGDERIKVVIASLAEATVSLAPFLRAWATSCCENAVWHLAQLIDETADEIMTKRTVRLWGESSVHGGELATWLASPAPERILRPNRQAILTSFPLLDAQLDGIRAAVSSL